MASHFILGTAGHIDHGKTSLVKALTGTDTDRLPEEKARGITIDIGFASLDLGTVRLGVVDVPGHERFIKNMLAGATGIDLAMLVIAADDSVMPQTREHLEILQFLGVKRGVIALTKADLVDDTTREVAMLEIRELVAGTLLENAPIIPTSTVNGAGIAELKAELKALAESTSNASSFPFRLAIDRVFVRQGHGTVVTGTVLSGSLKTGDEIDWHYDGETETVRVRGLNHHGQSVDEIRRGQRGAINLAGVEHTMVRRGQELAAAGFLAPSRLLSLSLKAAKELHRPLRHRLPVRFHVGTAEVMGRLSLLESNTLEAGQSTIAQVFLEEPVTAIWGQPLVIRSASAEATLAGGRVIQPQAAKLRRRHRDSLEKLSEAASNDAKTRTAAVIWFQAFEGCDADDLTRLAGIDAAMAEQTLQQLVREQVIIGPDLIHKDRLGELEQRILKRLAQLHAQHPLLTKHDREHALAPLLDACPHAVLDLAVARLLKARKLVGDAKLLARADFKPRLSDVQQKLKDRIVEEIRVAKLAPPEPESYANAVGGSMKIIREIFDVAVEEGHMVKVTDAIYFHKATAEEMIGTVKAKMQGGKKATVAEIRDWLGTTRKYAVPICEYLDRVKITRRQGDVRVLV